MIKTSLGKEIDYSTLGKILQDILNSNPALNLSVKVNCFEEYGNIMVIVEHQDEKISHPHRIFRVIRQTVQKKRHSW